MEVNQPITSFMNDAILTPLHLIDTKLNEFANILQKELKEINNKIEKWRKKSSINSQQF